jgi:predicted RNA-binding Zn-ribbon protein involved in translation (DUF1610 family)
MRTSGQHVRPRRLWMHHDTENACGYSGMTDTDYDPEIGVYAWVCPDCGEDVFTEDQP